MYNILIIRDMFYLKYTTPSAFAVIIFYRAQINAFVVVVVVVVVVVTGVKRRKMRASKSRFV